MEQFHLHLVKWIVKGTGKPKTRSASQDVAADMAWFSCFSGKDLVWLFFKLVSGMAASLKPPSRLRDSVMLSGVKGTAWFSLQMGWPGSLQGHLLAYWRPHIGFARPGTPGS